MAALKDTVDFYWDPICPWCWITSRWMEDVCGQKHIGINWKFFSLKKINEGRIQIMPDHFQQIQTEGLMALRVAAAVRREVGNEGVRKLYTAFGALYHHDQEDLGDPGALEGVLKVCGFPVELAAAAGDKSLDEVIEADMDQATEKAGTDVGVPLIVLDGGAGPLGCDHHRLSYTRFLRVETNEKDRSRIRNASYPIAPIPEITKNLKTPPRQAEGYFLKAKESI